MLSPAYEYGGKTAAHLSPVQAAAWARFRQALDRGELTHRSVAACPLCDGLNHEIIAERDRYGNRVVTVCCQGCGLIFTSNPLDDVSLERFYASYYRDLYETDLSDDMLVARFEMMRSTMTSRAAKFTRFLNLNPSEDTVIELGAGAGWQLVPFRSLGYIVTGFDYDSRLIAVGQREGIEIYDIRRKSPDEQTSSASLCLAIEVLEHAPDPFEFLAHVNRCLRTGGYLFLSVPALPDIPFGYANGRLLYTLQNAHLFLFDRCTLKAFLKMAGFEIVFLRHDMTALARKVTGPRRTHPRIPDNFQHNLAMLRFTEKVTRHYWGLIDRITGNRYESYYRVSRLHQVALSASRRRDFFRKKRITGY